MKTKNIGKAVVDAVVEWIGPVRDPLTMYTNATTEMIDRHKTWMLPIHMDEASGMLNLIFQSYLIRTPRYTILVDSCRGNDKERPLRPDWHQQSWPWMANFRAAGVEPEDIDFLLCTHLHTDHVGWNTMLRDGRWVPTFPNARYLFSETEYAFWESRYREDDAVRDSFADSVLPVVEAGQVDLVKGDHEIDSGLWLEPTPGHTPGHVCLYLESGGDHAVFCGDLVHHPIQIREPQLRTIFCNDPEMSSATRMKFMDKHTDTDTLILPIHFTGESAGHIVSQGNGRVFKFDEG